MSGLFSAIGIAGSGAEAMQTWMDTTAGNIANIGDVVAVGNPTYAQQTPFFVPTAEQGTAPGVGGGEGVAVQQVQLGTSTGLVVEQATNPLSNAQGEVAVPNITLGNQIANAISAQESYSADALTIARAKQSYLAGLTIGS